jgi:hypothetical protein
MVKQLKVERSPKGLFSFPNPLSEVPEGALVEALNVVIDREGVLSKRRGFARYGQATQALVNAIFEFKDRLLIHEGSSLRYDSDGGGTWISYSGLFGAPDADIKMHGVEDVSGALYLTSDTGVRTTDGLTKSPVPAGVPVALDVDLTFTGTGGSWFLVDTQVGYRIVWGRIDDLQRVIRGAPSMRETVPNVKTTGLAWSRSGTDVTITHTAHGFSNGDTVEILNSSDTTAIPNGAYVISSVLTNSYHIVGINAGGTSGTLSDGKRFNVNVRFTIPDGIKVGDFYEIYRTDLSAAATADPGDRHFRIERKTVQAADLAGKTITFLDNFDPAFLGEDLYSNAEVEGLGKVNTPPPWARDLALFKLHLHYANTMRPEFVELKLNTTLGISNDTDFIRFTIGPDSFTYTAAAAEDIPTRKWQNFAAVAGLLESQKVERSAKSLVRVINRDTGNTNLYAWYVSGIEDAPGSIVVERRTLNTARFTVTVNSSGFGGKWTPALPTSGSAVSSDNDRGINRLYRAKLDQPQAVPELDWDPVGSAKFAILRILALRDSLIILKEEGVWRLSGESEAHFTIKQLDPTTHVRAPEAAVVLDNAVYCLSTQGVVRITEAGTQIVSRPIEGELKELFSVQGYERFTHAVGYESERKYILFTVDQGTGAAPTVAWVYDYLTRAWTKWQKRIRAAHVLFKRDKLYLAHDLDQTVLEERKTFSLATNFQDYQDEAIAGVATVTAVGTTTSIYGETVTQVDVTWPYHMPIAEGWGFTQGTQVAAVTAVTILDPPFNEHFRLALDQENPNYITGACTMTIGIPSRARWTPEDADQPGVLKQYMEVQAYLEEIRNTTVPTTYRLGFRSDLHATESFVSNIRNTSPFIVGGTPLRVIVPRDERLGRSLEVVFEHKYIMESFHLLALSYIFRPISERTAVRT